MTKITQPWNDDRLKLNGVYIGCVTKENADYLSGLERKLDAAQAKIDALMLEFCPNEMSAEQMANWEKHQVPTFTEMANVR